MKCFNITLPNANVCNFEKEGIYQQVVFIRKSDIETFEINSRIVENEYLSPTVYHRIKFKLKENAKGYRLNLNENSSILTATFLKNEQNGVPTYEHKVSIGVFGNSEYYKWFLKQFDLSNEYFIAIQRKSDLIEIYGFFNGFKTNSYDYENNATIELSSTLNERDMPYIYESRTNGREVRDFENNFNSIITLVEDFNTDFNDSF